MITPPYLSKGDKIAIVSTARKISKEELLPAVEEIKNRGFEVVLGKNLFKEQHQFAGTDEERAMDLQNALDDPSIKAIFFARGGYGTVRLMDKIDFTKFIKQPKWLAGYSDVTVLHLFVNTVLGIETLHATMPVNYPTNTKESIDSLFNVLSGAKNELTFDANELNINNEIEGEIVGGNLSIIYSLTGTKLLGDLSNKILLIEDLDEYLYHIDRMMMNLKYAGVFDKISGLMVGGMTEMNDNKVPFGWSAEEIIYNVFKQYNKPLIYHLPVGHLNDNRAIILGRRTKITAQKLMQD